MKKVFLFCTLFLLGGATVLKAQTLEDVLSSYYKAIGGVDKWKTLKSTLSEGKGEQSGFQFPVKLLSARPNLTRLDVEVQGMFIIDAFDGEVAWEQMPFDPSKAKPTAKDKEATAEAAKENFEDDLIDYKEKGHTVTLEGTEEMDGAKTHKVHLVRKDGIEKFFFLDNDTYLPIAIRSFAKTGMMKGKAIDSYMSDFKEVGGMMMPHSIEQKVDSKTVFSIKIEEIKLNVPYEKADFSMPK